jgi:branched-chain amino acid transport system permease protein
MINLSFLLSAAMGALAGSVVSPITQSHYGMGTSLAIKGFTIAILGGLGNSTGALIAGLLLGIIEAFSITVIPMAYREVISIILLLLVLFFKPSGILGSTQKARLREF